MTGNTALHLAATGGRVEMVDLLFENGADILSQNLFRQTALDYGLSRSTAETDTRAGWKIVDRAKWRERSDICLVVAA